MIHSMVGGASEPLPFRTDEEVLEFLRTAKVISGRTVKVGVNGIEKLLLKKDGIRMHVAFRDVSTQPACAVCGWC